MIEGKKWTAFFSHTGSEIYNISRKINRLPDRIVTNNKPGATCINKNIASNTDIVYTSNRPEIEDYERIILEDSIVTLHGWMRIVPGKICKDYEIYNLHPGLITKYPELKGADPQKKVAEETIKEYDLIGCVIHRVTSGVDEGPVVSECSTRNNVYGIQSLTDKLHEMATDLWVVQLT